MATTIHSNNTANNQSNAGASIIAAEPKRLRTMADLINDYPGKAWYDAAARLAEWTEFQLVNRTDVYRAYRYLDKRFPGQSITFTAPWNEDARSYGSLTCHGALQNRPLMGASKPASDWLGL